MGGAHFQPLPSAHRVPQGSYVEPVLFLVIINNLDRLPFATSIFVRGKMPEDARLDALQTFTVAKQGFNGPCFNRDKTQGITRSLSYSDFQPGIGEVNLLDFVSVQSQLCV